MGLRERKRFQRGWGGVGRQEKILKGVGLEGSKRARGRERHRYNKKIAFNLLLFLTGSPL